MTAFVPIGLSSAYKQTGWSACFCPFCLQYEAARVEDSSVRLTLFSKTIAEFAHRKTFRCDFCHQSFAARKDVHIISTDAWHRTQGLRSLFHQIFPNLDVHPSRTLDRPRMQALLKSITSDTSLAKIDVSMTGLILGAIISIPLSIPLAILLHEQYLTHTHLAKFAFVAGCIILGIAVGATIGALINGLLVAPRITAHRIKDACSKYDIDLEKLELLSRLYPPRVKNAVANAYYNSLTSPPTASTEPADSPESIPTD